MTNIDFKQRSRACSGAFQRLFLPLALVVSLAVLPGCSSRAQKQAGAEAVDDLSGQQRSEQGEAKAQGEAKKDGADVPENPLPYEVEFTVVDEAKGVRADWEDPSYLVGKLKGASKLVRLKKTLPDGELGLELRARGDVKAAESLMQSEGFYEGSADLLITGAASGKAKVVIAMRPGRRYSLGDVRVVYSPAPLIPEKLQGREKDIFPENSIAGLESGRPVEASTILSKVSAVAPALRENGYPDAKLSEQHYYLDREKRTVNVVLLVDAGRPAVLGDVVLKGESSVNQEYLAKLAPWKPGEEVWDSRKVDDYLTTLRRTGLFKNVTQVVLDCGTGADASEVRPVGVKVEDAEHRTVSGMVRYDTDTGAGVELGWQHRNLFGNAEKLTLTAPISTKEHGLKGQFEKPEFFAHNQFLKMSGSAIREVAEAYTKESLNLSGGVERRWFDRLLSLYCGLVVDQGWLDPTSGSKQGYSVYGTEIRGKLDARDNELSPSSGGQIELYFNPMTGEYDGDFTALGSKVSLTGYYSPFRKPDGAPDDKLVLAGKVEAASLSGASLRNIPASNRYYLGGSGTVRGYGYQQIGPMDEDDDPIGGRSYQFVNLETRFKVTDSLGFVAFLDGGMVYTDEMPKFKIDEMSWGAGAGVRYFTPIGPVRFDVGVPLKVSNPPLQFYISIGQAF